MNNNSSKKRYRQNKRDNISNNVLKSRARTLLRRAIQSLTDDSNELPLRVREFKSSIDRAAQKGSIHPRKAARLKSRLEIKVRGVGR